MTRVLLTGGTGFLASHVLELLLQHGHSVVTTVRSQEKADLVAKAHPSYGKDKLSFAIVEDISNLDAFEKAVVSDPPFETVIHTASPFHYNVKDVQKDLLDPAVNGTTGILKAIKKSAPSVKRVVITSSFAAIVDPSRKGPTYKYSHKDWSAVTQEEALESPLIGYRASKTFAEKAAWDFVEKEKPNFDIATINPPLIFGPVVPYLSNLSSVNTSNERFAKITSGEFKDKVPATGTHLWVDVRDVANAHVLAAEKAAAGGKRFFIVAGSFSNEDIVNVAREKFPELKDKLPTSEEALKEAGIPKDDNGVPQIPGYDVSQAEEVLGLTYNSFETAATDTIKSILKVRESEGK